MLFMVARITTGQHYRPALGQNHDRKRLLKNWNTSADLALKKMVLIGFQLLPSGKAQQRSLGIWWLREIKYH